MDEINPGDVIPADIPCVVCAFSLKGLRNEGRCPECGKPIRSSTRSSRLCFRRAMWWDRAIQSIAVVAGIASPVLLLFAWVLNDHLMRWVCIGTASLAINVGGFGVWVSYFVRHSWLVRWAVLAAVICLILVLFLGP